MEMRKKTIDKPVLLLIKTRSPTTGPRTAKERNEYKQRSNMGTLTPLFSGEVAVAQLLRLLQKV